MKAVPTTAAATTSFFLMPASAGCVESRHARNDDGEGEDRGGEELCDRRAESFSLLRVCAALGLIARRRDDYGSGTRPGMFRRVHRIK